LAGLVVGVPIGWFLGIKPAVEKILIPAAKAPVYATLTNEELKIKSAQLVSAIRGHAVGAGLAVALLADVSIAADTARILDGHTRLGVAAGDHAVIIWPLLCGLAKARYYLLTNKSMSGAEAERIGLVGLCVPDAIVVETAFEVARTLNSGSRTAIRFTKHALNNWLRLAGPSFDASLALEMLGFRLSDAREGVDAVKSKRRPEF